MLDIFIILCIIIISLFFKLYVFSAILIVILLIYIIRHVRKKSYTLHKNYKPESVIQTFDYYIDINDSYKKIVDMLQHVQTTVVYSCFACNMTTPFCDGHSMQQLLNQAAERGVSVHILYNTTAEYTNNTIEELQELLDTKIRITTITAAAQIHESLQDVLKQKAYSYNHQKFLICDETILFGGCDIDPWERKGYHIINKNNFYWHEIAISFTAPPSFMDWLIQFSTLKSIPVKKMPAPPSPFVNKKTEIDAMLYMIKESKHILYIEHQLLAVTQFSDKYSQAIVDSISNRLLSACKYNEDLQIHIITNVSQDDEYNMFTQFFSSNTLILSICHILSNIPAEYKQKALEKLHIYRLKNNIHNIKVHSNIFITDDEDGNYHLLRSSSNLSDRSFGKYPCDIELGVYVHGAKVYDLYKQLVQLHTNGNDTISETGYLQKIPIDCDNELMRSTAFFITQTHPATGHCTHKMLIKNIQ